MGSGASKSKKASGQELERKIEILALDDGAEIESEDLTTLLEDWEVNADIKAQANESLRQITAERGTLSKAELVGMVHLYEGVFDEEVRPLPTHHAHSPPVRTCTRTLA